MSIVISFTTLPFSMTDTPQEYCIYDIGDDAIIVQGTFIEMEDLLDTMAGNVIVTTLELVEQYRQKLDSIKPKEL